MKIEWRFKRKTKVVHAFTECSGVSLCGLMLAGNGPLTRSRTGYCVLCDVQVANLTGVPYGSDSRDHETTVDAAGESDRDSGPATEVPG